MRYAAALSIEHAHKKGKVRAFSSFASCRYQEKKLELRARHENSGRSSLERGTTDFKVANSILKA